MFWNYENSHTSAPSHACYVLWKHFYRSRWSLRTLGAMRFSAIQVALVIFAVSFKETVLSTFAKISEKKVTLLASGRTTKTLKSLSKTYLIF
jgi:hypothetical protein